MKVWPTRGLGRPEGALAARAGHMLFCLPPLSPAREHAGASKCPPHLSHTACLQLTISSAFESSVGIAQYAHLAHAVDAALAASPQPAAHVAAPGGSTPARGSWAAVAADAARASAEAAGAVPPALPPRIQTAHGLGTASWFAQDVVSEPLLANNGVQGALAGVADDRSGQRPSNGFLALQQGSAPGLGQGLPLERAEQVLQNYALHLGASQSTVQDDVQLPQLAEQQCQVATPAGVYSFRVVEPCHQGPPALGARDERPLLLFLHGFLGAAEDWQPVMQVLCTRCRCLAVDLPGHGQTRVRPGHSGAELGDSLCSWGVCCFLLLQEQQAVVSSSSSCGFAMHAHLHPRTHSML